MANKVKPSQETIETVLFLMKPDGMKNEIKIIKYLKRTGLEIVHSQLVNVTRDSILQHYAKSNSWYEKYGRKSLEARGISTEVSPVSYETALEEGMKIPDAIADYMVEKDMRAFVIKGVNAISILRILLGDTEPASAKKNTLRGMFSSDSFQKAWTDSAGPRAIQNVAHASDSESEAYREACIFIGKEEASLYFKDYLDELASAKNDELVRLARSAGK